MGFDLKELANSIVNGLISTVKDIGYRGNQKGASLEIGRRLVRLKPL